MVHIKQRYDNVVKSVEDKRTYRGLLLNNHLKVLLISDPTTDKSSAAMDINIGEDIYCLVENLFCTVRESHGKGDFVVLNLLK